MRMVKHWLVFGMEIPEDFVALRILFPPTCTPSDEYNVEILYF